MTARPGSSFPSMRMRRMRRDEFSRRLMRETHLTADALIYPLFVVEGRGQRQPVGSMPGIERLSVDELLRECAELMRLRIPAIALFPVTPPEKKTLDARESWNPHGIAQQAVRAVKKEFPGLGVITDVALDPFTTHGQDGIDRRERLRAERPHRRDAGPPGALARRRRRGHRRPVGHDGRAHRSRSARHSKRPASSIRAFSPTRPSTRPASTARFAKRSARRRRFGAGNKYTYQMDPANSDEALREVALDIAEGADMVMIKPGLPYLDIVRRIKDRFGMPTFVYQVSGEYSMIMAAAGNGWIDERAVGAGSAAVDQAGRRRRHPDLLREKAAQWLA
jgi:porphobilinogen synthase